MARPRLVQEGIPLYGPGSDAIISRDDEHSMSNDSHHWEEKEQKNVSLTGVSSLQRAAAVSSKNRQNRSTSNLQKTKYVIGGVAASAPSPTVTNDGHPFVNQSPSNPRQQQWNHTISSENQDMRQYNTSQTFAQHHHETPSMEMQTESDQHHLPYQSPSHYNPHTGINHIDSNNEQLTRSESTKIRTSHMIGVENFEVPQSSSNYQSVEKMEGVQDHGRKMPLIVLDGANVAHAYTTALASLNPTKYRKNKGKPEPDSRGISVAVDYFVSTGIRVLVVLPQYWLRKKPRSGDNISQNSMMETEQLDILSNLNDKGLIVASPPADDDDAYCLTIAKREETRALRQRDGEGPGFVLSNDMFRDAQVRDSTGMLRQWLNQGRDESIGPGRISYTFCDMGTMDDQ
jgi:hypothetical protein